MTQSHEILFLNSSRVYLRVGNTWYDGTTSFHYEIGDIFVIGKIEEILSYAKYKARFPTSKNEMGPSMSDKTNSGDYIRKVSNKADSQGRYNNIVEYTVNSQRYKIDTSKADIND